MFCVFVNIPEWIEALAAVAIVVLTLLTLLVLRDYAADTKTIAKVSLSQAEDMQKPFLVLLSKPQELNRHGGGWALENQGFGPAINIRHSDPEEMSSSGEMSVPSVGVISSLWRASTLT